MLTKSNSNFRSGILPVNSVSEILLKLISKALVPSFLPMKLILLRPSKTSIGGSGKSNLPVTKMFVRS